MRRARGRSQRGFGSVAGKSRLRRGRTPVSRGRSERAGSCFLSSSRHDIQHGGTTSSHLRGRRERVLETDEKITGVTFCPSRHCRFRSCGGVWAVQAEAQRGHQNVGPPDTHARGSTGLRRGRHDLRCALFDVSGILGQTQTVGESQPEACVYAGVLICLRGATLQK